jgi:hypothetical protein
MRKTFRSLSVYALFLPLFLLAACCAKNQDGSDSCPIDSLLNQCSSQVTGYVLFGAGITPTVGYSVVIQWSTDNFATVTNSGTSLNNTQGFPSVPFDFRASYTCGSLPDMQFRAYEAPTSSFGWSLGDAVGRKDDTSTGNGTYIPVQAINAKNIQIILDNRGTQ